MKIIKTETIQDDEGQRLQIETDDKGDYKFIWIDANNLVDVADFLEALNK